MDPKPVPYNKLVIGELYEVTVTIGGLAVSVTLPYRGQTDDKGQLFFADGPNGVWVHPNQQPRIYRYEDTL